MVVTLPQAQTITASEFPAGPPRVWPQQRPVGRNCKNGHVLHLWMSVSRFHQDVRACASGLAQPFGTKEFIHRSRPSSQASDTLCEVCSHRQGDTNAVQAFSRGLRGRRYLDPRRPALEPYRHNLRHMVLYVAEGWQYERRVDWLGSSRRTGSFIGFIMLVVAVHRALVKIDALPVRAQSSRQDWAHHD